MDSGLFFEVTTVLRHILFIAAILLFLINTSSKKSSKNSSDRAFILFSLLITLLIYLFDVFSIHHLLKLEFRIPNIASYGLFAALFIYYLWRFRTKFFESRPVLILLSIICMILAAVFDMLSDGKIIQFSYGNELEYILKLLLVLFWLLFFVFRLNLFPNQNKNKE